MDYRLGKMKRINDLRSVWPHEANDFTKWLAEESNLQILSESVDIDITLEERESSVGDFNVDIYAREEGSGRKIIIENQLEDTNHDHLGKIITYASGKGAEVIIWIVKRARDEHRQAIEWLNQHTDSEIAFFLVEIELWQIDSSALAPKFNVVEKPNDWAKSMKAVEGKSDTEKLKLEFWQAFVNCMRENEEYKNNFSFRKPAAQHWYTLAIGHRTCSVDLLINTQKRNIGAEIYIRGDKDTFERFKEKKEAFETKLGKGIDWNEAKKDCNIVVRKELDIKDRTKWEEAFKWFVEKSVILKGLVRDFDK